MLCAVFCIPRCPLAGSNIYISPRPRNKPQQLCCQHKVFMSLQIPSPLCSCSTDLPLSLKHILHHQTTRTPLFVHPSCWSEAHLKFLRIVVKSLPPYPSSPESNLQIPPTSCNASIQSGIGHGTQNSPSVQEIICSTILIVDDCSNAIDREFPIFQQVHFSA